MQEESCFFDCPVGTLGSELVDLLNKTNISYKLFSLSQYEIPELAIGGKVYSGYEHIKDFLTKTLQKAPISIEPGGVST